MRLLHSQMDDNEWMKLLTTIMAKPSRASLRISEDIITNKLKWKVRSLTMNCFENKMLNTTKKVMQKLLNGLCELIDQVITNANGVDRLAYENNDDTINVADYYNSIGATIVRVTK